MRERHNSVLQRVVRALSKEGKDMFVEQSFSPTNLRPDIVVHDRTTKEAVVVDVMVPYESGQEALLKARREKEQKYEGLRVWMSGQGDYSTVSVHALVVGSLGSWDPANQDCLRALRIGAHYSKLFRKLCVVDAIKGSHGIWKAR